MIKRIISITLALTLASSVIASASIENTATVPTQEVPTLMECVKALGINFPIVAGGLVALGALNELANKVEENQEVIETQQVKLPRKYKAKRKIIQRSKKDKKDILGIRVYDVNGDVFMDIHTTDHGNPKQHNFKNNTHKHTWYKESKDSLPIRNEEAEELTDEEYMNYVTLPKSMLTNVWMDEIAFDIEEEYKKEIGDK